MSAASREACIEILQGSQDGASHAWVPDASHHVLVALGEILQIFQNRSIIWLNHLTPGNLPKWNEIRIWKSYLRPNVSSILIHSSQEVESTQLPINRWFDKGKVVYIITLEYYAAMKKNFCNQVDPIETIVLSVISQSQKDKCVFPNQW